MKIFLLVVLFISLGSVRVMAQETSSGETIYKSLCAGCHGDGGEGNGPAAIAFSPRPTDFTAQDSTSFTLDNILKVLREGKGQMPPFTSLTEDEKSAVANHI